MVDERHRATNRRAIATAFGVWAVCQVLVYSGANSVAGVSADWLAIAGLAVLPFVLSWTWFSRRLRCPPNVGKRSAKEAQHENLVSLEIAALSAMLIYLMVQVPP